MVESSFKNIVWYVMSPEKLKERERNYTTHDLELVVIVHQLKMWIYYLIGSKFELRTYHCGLNICLANQH
jgi:hypothetical protein